MGDTTDTWLIVVAAFGGGLAGAILQPLMSYALDRVRSTETIRKNRERSLRRMLFAKIRATRTVQAWAMTRALEQELGRSPSTGSLPIGGPFWEPHRIKEPELKNKVEEYSGLSASLYTAGYRLDVGEIRRLDEKLDALQVEITLTMDDLNWPEAELEDV